MLNFKTIPASQLPTKTSRNNPIEKSLEDKFRDKKLEIWKHEHRHLREFHFVTIEHNGKLILLKGTKGDIIAELDNPQNIDTKRKAREIYVSIIIGNEKTEGGCYFN